MLSIANRNGSTSMDNIVGFMITLFLITVIVGFVLSLFSLKETPTLKKYVALSINSILMIMLVINVLQNLSTIQELFS